ncbi:hypothetical protein SAMN06298216_3870 [Spirosomataceae bacterium TFI 002]|nr:hypothetical protein SAMN06298216_3870 [Spirosomataceae bacterium TFI 002]
MKKLSVLVLVLLTAFSVQAQKGNAWEGLSNMKSIMKQTFPPLIKENNLQPAKNNAAKLYEKAVEMENGVKPKAFRKKAMNEKFSSITSLAKELNDLVIQKASDEDIKIGLVNLHGAFAEIAHHKKAPGGGKHK